MTEGWLVTVPCEVEEDDAGPWVSEEVTVQVVGRLIVVVTTTVLVTVGVLLLEDAPLGAVLLAAVKLAVTEVVVEEASLQGGRGG